MLTTPHAELAHDVSGPLPTADGRPPTGPATTATAAHLGLKPVGYPGQPEAFVERRREVLA
jgi:hypothetical protein